jgi:hypothetical protein
MELISLAEIDQQQPKNPEVEKLSQEAQGLLERAKTIIVSSAEEYAQAGQIYAAIKQRRKDVEAERKKRTDPLNMSLKLINADFRAIDEILEAAGKPYENGMLAYKHEEERQRLAAKRAALEEQKRIEEEARKLAAEEMAKLEAAKQAAKAAEVATEQAANPLAAYVAKAQAEQAEQAIADARQATENALRTAAMAPAAVTVNYPPLAKAAGTSFRTAWKYRIVDAALIPREYLIPNEQMLGALARTAKAPSTIPGVEFYAEKSIGGR